MRMGALLQEVIKKVDKCTQALIKLMPNITGPSSKKKKDQFHGGQVPHLICDTDMGGRNKKGKP